jgi:hypothetical protein
MMNEDSQRMAPRLIVVIVDRKNTRALEYLLKEKEVHLHYMFNARGTARSGVLASLGLSGSDKTVCLAAEPRATALPLMTSLSDRLELFRKGNGIAFYLPLSGVSAAVSKMFEHEKEKRMDTSYDETAEICEIKYSLVLSVVNQGFSEEVMNAAHSVGVPGGTIVNARHSNIEDAVKFFGVSLQSEKEIVAIVVPQAGKKPLMQAITKSCGMGTPAHGLVVSLPVENCAGIGEVRRD